MKNLLASVAVAALAALTLAVPAAQTNTVNLPACITEDADNCYWDAQTQGNGEGKSFIVINGEVTYM